MKPYYEEDGITIYHGDCRDMMREYERTCDRWEINVITDPPYGINHPTNYAERGRGNLAACSDYAPVFGDGEPFDPAPFIKWNCLLFGANNFAARLPEGGWIVWDKERPLDLDQSTAELAWSNFVKGVRVFRHLWNGMMRASENEPLSHPTQKPVALMKWILRLKWMPQDGNILDPFMGSGTTLRAAKDLGRRAIGIEIEEKYCEIAAKRLAQKVLGF